ncbi:MAG: hydrogenase nickel incorporation protein HypB [Syntrophorhabdales bacterium]|jgi:hydrogenase nickel incorporation protein HypB
MKIKVVKNILDANEQMAAENKLLFKKRGVVAVNIMASPGAGKTSLILRTIEELGEPIAVIEGDIASTFDAEKVGEKQVPVVQINTGGACHLDASMIRTSLDKLRMDNAKYLFIENVGNLVCPAEFQLGENVRVLVASVPEGDDKPFKYPGMFSTVQAIVLNKMDIVRFIDFSVARFMDGVRAVNAKAPVFQVSCRTKEGIPEWIDWLRTIKS